MTGLVPKNTDEHLADNTHACISIRVAGGRSEAVSAAYRGTEEVPDAGADERESTWATITPSAMKGQTPDSDHPRVCGAAPVGVPEVAGLEVALDTASIRLSDPILGVSHPRVCGAAPVGVPEVTAA